VASRTRIGGSRRPAVIPAARSASRDPYIPVCRTVGHGSGLALAWPGWRPGRQ